MPRPKGSKNKYSEKKKGRSAYFHFIEAKKEETQKEFPDLKHPAILGKIAKIWNELPEVDRVPYKKLAEEERQQYFRNKKEFLERKSCSEFEKAVQIRIEENTIDKNDDVHKVEIEHEDESSEDNDEEEEEEVLRPPKKGKSAFFYFVDAKNGQTQKEYSIRTESVTVSTLSKAWAQMSETEQNPFHELARHDRERYRREKEVYDLKCKAKTQQEESGKRGPEKNFKGGIKTQKKTKTVKYFF